MNKAIDKIYNFLSKNAILQCIRNSLVNLLPILLIGAFSIVLMSMPIPAYKDFIEEFGSGFILDVLNYINIGTFGMVSIYMVIALSINYTKKFMPENSMIIGPSFVSLVCFCMFSGATPQSFQLSSIGVDGMFTAIICALSASALYSFIYKRTPFFFKLYSEGMDSEFISGIKVIFPASFVIIFYAVINQLIITLCNVSCLQELFTKCIYVVFENMGNSFETTLIYVLLSSIMWFFGIHGSDVLEPIGKNIYGDAIAVNNELIASGLEPTEIYSKTFIDVFVVMGGCGTTICLLLAIILFGKRTNTKKLAKMSTLPIVFNINEIMILGLPVVFNPILFIPFVITPLVMVVISGLSMNFGLVPMIVNEVEWTTPVFISGYISTGSVKGVILQIICITVGIMIYRPFVRKCEMDKQSIVTSDVKKLIKVLQDAEEESQNVSLLNLNNELGGIAHSISDEIKFRIRRELPTMHYQPQFDNNNNCVGAEALLRWNSSAYGMLYPPLIIKIADESNILFEFEKAVFNSVKKDMPKILEIFGADCKISINVSGKTIQTDEFEMFLAEYIKDAPQMSKNICIEITEQNALLINDAQINRIARIHQMGYSLAIDDFSMGSTSIKYLQMDAFSIIKLDGSLSKDIMKNSRSRNIVSSIVGLADKFDISVLAEFVETEEQKKTLEELGCIMYQGWLYSPAVPLEDLERKGDVNTY